MDAAAAHSNRSAGALRLIAVSKTRTAQEITAVAKAGITDFGENYLQDALPKIRGLDRSDITWHFIGTIQSNKTRDIARYFQWVHTLDRVKIAERLHRFRAGLPRLDVCIQVNIDVEPQKGGVDPGGVRELIDTVRAHDNLRLRGLMVIPAAQDDAESTRPSFSRAAELFDAHRSAGGEHWDTLSMGMSGDYVVAIDEGATCVRIGTAIFGPRR